MNFAFGYKRWFGTAELGRTVTVGAKTTTNVVSTNAGVRTGWSFRLGKGRIFSPYLVANYLDLNQTVKGTNCLPDAFGPSDDLYVSYSVKTENADKWKGGLGFIFIINEDWMVNAE